MSEDADTEYRVPGTEFALDYDPKPLAKNSKANKAIDASVEHYQQQQWAVAEFVYLATKEAAESGDPADYQRRLDEWVAATQDG